MKYTNSEWIDTCIKKYGDRFSYEETQYINSYHKVLIRCIEHNEVFAVDPIQFLRTSSSGHFCPTCKKNRNLTNEEFCEKVNNKYGTRYNLSKTIFKTIRDSVILTCYEHGDFEKQARQIIYGKILEICPKCIEDNKLLGSVDKVKEYTDDKALGSELGVFYKLLITHKDTNIKFIKIGITRNSVAERYRCGYDDFKIEVLDEIYDTNLNVAILENEYKKNNKHKRFYIPKYIKFNGRSECYMFDDIQQLSASNIKFIRDSLLLKQDGICPICKNIVSMPTLDHFHQKRNHGDGKIRAVLCNTCNRFAGLIENNLARNLIDPSDAPEVLRNMANHLENNREPFLHPNEKPKAATFGKREFNKVIKYWAKMYPKKKVPEWKEKLRKGKPTGRMNLTKNWEAWIKYANEWDDAN